MNNNDAPRVLVIDDNAGLRTSLASVLETAGYSVRTGADGQQGVAIAREFKPAVVVCDMHMPHGSGSSVLSTLRQEESFILTQFVLMTGDVDGTPQRVGMNFGADDYLAKPFTMQEFLHCVNARLQRSLLHKKAQHRALAHFRETISHNLPHEVFTPLTGILGFTEVLKDEIGSVTPQEAGAMVAEIHISAERLYRTLKNYLRILDVLNDKSAASMTGEQTPAAAVGAVVLAATKSVTVRYDRAKDFSLDCAEIAVPFPASDLSTIVIELVDNACKYSTKGTPVVLRLQSTSGQIEFSVTDRGRGMTPEQIAQIGAFRQFDRNKYEQQGLGLGLTLTQHLVERHGGQFHLASSAGTGTTVTATWPQPIT